MPSSAVPSLSVGSAAVKVPSRTPVPMISVSRVPTAHRGPGRTAQPEGDPGQVHDRSVVVVVVDRGDDQAQQPGLIVERARGSSVVIILRRQQE
ncbi:hypothetical protein [Nocardia sp. NPDC050412]|uniref:hypothetical protein n=1 Tax=Nocardia sp. NPDC050412 TaxID=3364320 RepID=UPI00379BD8EF